MSEQEPEQVPEKIKKPESKEDRIRREKSELLERISCDNLTDLNSKVAFVLNHFPSARNSDIDLTTQYWKIFDKDIVGYSDSITYKQLYKVTRMNSLIRARAKIQNTYGLFLANDRVRKKRFELDDERRQIEVDDQPGYPSISVYCDESGKTQDNLIIGSLWINDGYRVLKLYQALTDWKKGNNIEYEFHFSDLKKQRISEALEFFKIALSASDALGLKAAIINKKDIGASHLDEAIYNLHYQLVVQGLEHERDTKRIEFPRELSITKDKDDGVDKLRLTGLKQKLKSDCVSYFKNEIEIGAVEAEDSKFSVFLQLADLFAGSISRVINKIECDPLNHKDEFAEAVLKLLGINSNLTIESGSQDFVEIIRVN